jgi:hypothetical protein
MRAKNVNKNVNKIKNVNVNNVNALTICPSLYGKLRKWVSNNIKYLGECGLWENGMKNVYARFDVNVVNVVNVLHFERWKRWK